MKKLYTALFVVLCLCAFNTDLLAQWNIGLNFNYTTPLDQYDQNLAKDPKGFSMNTLYSPFKGRHLMVGAELGISMYANDEYDIITSGGEEIQIDEEDCFLSYHALLRYQLAPGQLFNPYVEGRLGGVSFFSTRMAEEGAEEYFESETSFHGTAFNMSVGGGLALNVGPNVAIDLGVSLNRGAKTDYRSIEAGDASLRRSLDYGVHKSYTHCMNYRLGILLGF